MESMASLDNPPRTDHEQEGTGWRTQANLPAEARLHYRDSFLEPWTKYRGPLEDLSLDEARGLFAELLKLFPVDHDAYAPLPPTGLPGIAANPLSRYSDEFRLIAIGLSYLGAVVRNEGKAMHYRWEAASEMLRNRPPPPPPPRRRPFNRERPEQSVYFIGAESGPIKIGVAANPTARLASLQTGHHEKLEILATCPGGQTQEYRYHDEFAAYRLHGEWFVRVSEIEAEIARLKMESE